MEFSQSRSLASGKHNFTLFLPWSNWGQQIADQGKFVTHCPRSPLLDEHVLRMQSTDLKVFSDSSKRYLPKEKDSFLPQYQHSGEHRLALKSLWSVNSWAPYDPTTSYELGYVNKHTSSLVQELRHLARLHSAPIRLSGYTAHSMENFSFKES